VDAGPPAILLWACDDDMARDDANKSDYRRQNQHAVIFLLVKSRTLHLNRNDMSVGNHNEWLTWAHKLLNYYFIFIALYGERTASSDRGFHLGVEPDRHKIDSRDFLFIMTS
jgi:hypothetical protein